MKRVKVILPHAGIVLSLMFMVFLVLDDYNPMMNFLTNSISTVLLGVFCLISFVNSILVISTARRSKELKQDSIVPKTDPPSLRARREGVPDKGECSL